MKIIRDGDCYNQILEGQVYGDKFTYETIREPPESEVLMILDYKQTTLQAVNFFLLKTDRGFVLEYGDSIDIMTRFRVTYLDFVEWVKQQYLDKQFSWQKEVVDETI